MLLFLRSIFWTMAGNAYFFACITDRNVAFQHGFWLRGVQS